MRQATRTNLEKILVEHDREFLVNKGQFGTRKTTVETFNQAFEHLCADVIRPVMEDVKALLRQHEIHAEVIMEAGHTATGRAQPAKMTFELHVQTDAEAHGFPLTMPNVVFLAEPSTGKLQLHENTILPYLGGHAGLVREFAFEDVTQDVVEDCLVDLANRVLKGAKAA